MPYLSAEREKEYQKEYHETYKHTDQYKINARKQISKFPEKRKARNALSWAVFTGKITRPDICSFCGANGKIEGHHPDYSKPLDVQWLCSQCHLETC